ncbi:hypothetical protein [Candidatus Formimonas warabiya]|nr:hypothetical protein [Candidatus Formimonas warabiya]
MRKECIWISGKKKALRAFFGIRVPVTGIREYKVKQILVGNLVLGT